MKNTTTNRTYIALAAIVVLAVAAIFLPRACKRAAKRHTLTVVIMNPQQFPKDENADSIEGLQYATVKIFADSFRIPLVVLRQNDLKQSIADLIAHRCDIVASLIPATTEYNDQIAFTHPLLVSRQVLVQREDMAERTLKKQYFLARDTICIPTNSPQKQRLMNLSDEIADTIFIKEIPDVTSRQLVEAVAQGICKFTICNERLAKRMKARYPNLNISMPVGFEQPYCWAVRADDIELLDMLNPFIDKFTQSTKYKELMKKYE